MLINSTLASVHNDSSSLMEYFCFSNLLATPM
nr:MAG TPA: hypothetical protein [Caudoviricetes sp.]